MPQSMLLVALLLSLFVSTTAAALVASQRNALVQIYNALNGPSWTSLDQWSVADPSSDACTW